MKVGTCLYLPLATFYSTFLTMMAYERWGTRPIKLMKHLQISQQL